MLAFGDMVRTKRDMSYVFRRLQIGVTLNVILDDEDQAKVDVSSIYVCPWWLTPGLP